jgi:hypothetical protein
MMSPFVAQALGQIIYGVLFEQFDSLPWLIILSSAFVSVAAALLSHKHFAQCDEDR